MSGKSGRSFGLIWAWCNEVYWGGEYRCDEGASKGETEENPI